MNNSDPIAVGEVEQTRRELLDAVDEDADEAYLVGYIDAVLRFDRKLTDRRLLERDG